MALDLDLVTSLEPDALGERLAAWRESFAGAELPRNSRILQASGADYRFLDEAGAKYEGPLRSSVSFQINKFDMQPDFDALRSLRLTLINEGHEVISLLNSETLFFETEDRYP